MTGRKSQQYLLAAGDWPQEPAVLVGSWCLRHAWVALRVAFLRCASGAEQPHAAQVLELLASLGLCTVSATQVPAADQHTLCLVKCGLLV